MCLDFLSRDLQDATAALQFVTECYMKHYFDDLPDDNSKHKAVCEMLGFTGRAAKKARHATAARW